MARDFGGTGDQLTYGSDASIDAFAAKTVALWIQWDDTGIAEALLEKINAGTLTGWIIYTNTDDTISFIHLWTTNPAIRWSSNTTIAGGGFIQLVVTYDGGAVGNDPQIIINQTASTINEFAGPPTGAATSDAANTLGQGTGAALGLGDWDGRMQNFCVDNRVWDAGDINRHYWYGRSGGGIEILHPMLTDKTANEGTATAAMTVAVGTTMASLPRTERMHCASVGCGR